MYMKVKPDTANEWNGRDLEPFRTNVVKMGKLQNAVARDSWHNQFHNNEEITMAH